jgi:hypothetical protein
MEAAIMARLLSDETDIPIVPVPMDLATLNLIQDPLERLRSATEGVCLIVIAADMAEAVALSNHAASGGAVVISKQIFVDGTRSSWFPCPSCGVCSVVSIPFSLHLGNYGDTSLWPDYVKNNLPMSYQESTYLIRFHIFHRIRPWFVFCGKGWSWLRDNLSWVLPHFREDGSAFKRLSQVFFLVAHTRCARSHTRVLQAAKGLRALKLGDPTTGAAFNFSVADSRVTYNDDDISQVVKDEVDEEVKTDMEATMEATMDALDIHEDGCEGAAMDEVLSVSSSSYSSNPITRKSWDECMYGDAERRLETTLLDSVSDYGSDGGCGGADGERVAEVRSVWTGFVDVQEIDEAEVERLRWEFNRARAVHLFLSTRDLFGFDVADYLARKLVVGPLFPAYDGDPFISSSDE